MWFGVFGSSVCGVVDIWAIMVSYKFGRYSLEIRYGVVVGEGWGWGIVYCRCGKV